MYFKIKQKLTIRNFIFLAQKYLRACVITFYLLLSLSCLIIETVNHNYFNQIKNKVLGHDFLMHTILLPANFTNFVTNKANRYLARHYDLDNSIEHTSDVDFIALKEKNLQLKKLLHFVESNSFKVVTTDIVWQIRNKTSHYGIINIGTFQGIENGQAVINHSGLVGKIMNAQENRSEILFIDSDNFRAAVKIGENAHQAIITGAYSKKKLRLGYLQEDSPIMNNDSVITSGTYPNFKDGIFIGTFEFPDTVNTKINWGNLKLVSVVIPSLTKDGNTS